MRVVVVGTLFRADPSRGAHLSHVRLYGENFAPKAPSDYYREVPLGSMQHRDAGGIVISSKPVWDQLTGLPGRRNDPSLVRVADDPPEAVAMLPRTPFVAHSREFGMDESCFSNFASGRSA
jgi:hypothetical protein